MVVRLGIHNLGFASFPGTKVFVIGRGERITSMIENFMRSLVYHGPDYRHETSTTAVFFHASILLLTGTSAILYFQHITLSCALVPWDSYNISNGATLREDRTAKKLICEVPNQIL